MHITNAHVPFSFHSVPTALRAGADGAEDPSTRAAPTADAASNDSRVDAASETRAEVGGEGADHSSGDDPGGLTAEERARVEALQKRDREVRAHEQAHLAAAGSLAQGGPRYTTETGPDGRSYAVGGEVPISLKEGDTPEETARIANQARAAALAPVQPSSQDQAVAARATAMLAEARQEAASGDGAPAQAVETSAAPDAVTEDVKHADQRTYEAQAEEPGAECAHCGGRHEGAGAHADLAA